MKKLCISALAFAAVVLTAHAGFVDHQAALTVLGQSNFTTVIPGDPPTSSTLRSPEGVAIDPTSGKVFISDSNNYRILRFSSITAYTTGAAAEAVFGQADFSANLSNRGGTAAANTIGYAISICVDSAGRLWVPDQVNRRILRFDAAATKPAFGATADAVLGQPDFTTVAPEGTAANNNFRYPDCVAVDAAGTLWVADFDFNRVLKFTNAAAKPNGAAADAVLGQDLFTTSTSGTTADTMNGPYGVSVDSDGRLWVADATNNRVLRFDGASSKASGDNADGVLGQPNFTTMTPGTTATTTERPYYVTAGPDGTVWVSDYDNRRVLGFRAAAAKSAPASADIVLGQIDFTKKDNAATAQGMNGPSQIATVGTDTLFIALYGQSRVLRFGPAPAATLTAPAKVTARHGKAKIRGTSTGATRVDYHAGPGAQFKNTLGEPASWSIALRKLKKKITRVIVRAFNPDGTAVQKVVRVKSN